jgi:hypothetical protein
LIARFLHGKARRADQFFLELGAQISSSAAWRPGGERLVICTDKRS